MPGRDGVGGKGGVGPGVGIPAALPGSRALARASVRASSRWRVAASSHQQADPAPGPRTAWGPRLRGGDTRQKAAGRRRGGAHRVPDSDAASWGGRSARHNQGPGPAPPPRAAPAAGLRRRPRPRPPPPCEPPYNPPRPAAARPASPPRSAPGGPGKQRRAKRGPGRPLGYRCWGLRRHQVGSAGTGPAPEGLARGSARLGSSAGLESWESAERPAQTGRGRHPVSLEVRRAPWTWLRDREPAGVQSRRRGG